jgi:outer membrane protein OmpA-like peptidoglycan-associated protein
LSKTTNLQPSVVASFLFLLTVSTLPLLGCSTTHARLTAAQIAVLKQQGFIPKQDKWELGLSDKMLFDIDSDELKEQTKLSIEHTGGALASVSIRSVRVEGHTDSTGSDAHNLALSQRRAAAVAQALGKFGLAQPIGVKGFGKQDPIADNTTEEGRAENRRVAVIVPSDQQ